MPAAMLPPLRSTLPSGWVSVTAAGESPGVAWSGVSSACTSTVLDNKVHAIKDVIDFRITEFSFVEAFVPDAKVESQRPVNNPPAMDAVFRLRKHA